MCLKTIRETEPENGHNGGEQEGKEMKGDGTKEEGKQWWA